jgi:uncharacterized membrane protein
MYHYTAVQWIFIFFFYCFFGWCFESAYVSICKRKFVNRGFVRGPFLPLYGSGAVMMLLVSRPFQDNLFLVFLAGCIGATALEYVTGVVMETLFKVRYWDYSNQKFNFQGQICLSSTLCWGVLTVFMTRILHPPVERLVLGLPQRLVGAVSAVVSVWFLIDFAFSFQAAMDLRDILVKADQAKRELERMQKRLDVLIAVAGDELESKAEKSAQRRDELIADIEERFAELRKAMPGSELLREKKEELLELRERFIGDKRVGEEKLETFMRSINRRRMLRSNPTMTSRKFRETLEELKKSASFYKKDGREDKSE